MPPQSFLSFNLLWDKSNLHTPHAWASLGPREEIGREILKYEFYVEISLIYGEGNLI